MSTNAHHDRIQCPICEKRFDKVEKLEQHQRTKGHYHPHEPRPYAHLVKPVGE
ncbi:hypothetical protein [Shimia sediminis]|uniref:hypothetical protein n=1 Tax=Shimia sediminis TaxID=2497945 RepID=UPI0013DF0522|nr:hypothetical protein [Shimia sediminis]